MGKKIIFILLFFTLNLSYAFIATQIPLWAQSWSSLEPIKKGERILILAPHPDDEAIGCAGIIQDALRVGAKIQIVYLTNGEHNQIAFIVYEKRLTMRKGEFIHMGQMRRLEAIKAMKLLGVNERDLIFLGYPDFGTFAIFSQHWQDAKPYKSLLTRISAVPYKENLSFGAPYKGESILSDLKSILSKYKPNKIFVSHPADTNVDHKSLYLFLQIALRDLNREIPKPKIYPYLIHCAGWPLPRHYHPELSLEPPQKFSNSQINWLMSELTPEQLNKKYQAILCYKSQTESSAFYLLSFGRKNELFGDYPEVKLERQLSLKEPPPLFFGFSNFFASSDLGVVKDSSNFIQDKSQVSYAVADNALLIRVEKTKGVNRKFSFVLYLFGYSDKTSFAQMPKLRIITNHNKFRVFDGKKILKPEGVSLELDSQILTLKVPLQLLGNPETILTSIKSYKGILPVDTIGFRKIEIK